jgi:uncharacterized protein
MSAWVVPIEQVKETPRRFELEADAAWWEDAHEGLKEPTARMHRAFRLEVDGHRLGRRLLFRGDLRGSVDLACSRCLETYEEAFDESFQLLLEPAPDAASLPEAGIELDPDDPEVGRYAGDELDFGPAVLEILALAWPMQPRCGEGCRGLCPTCGTNWNVEPCSCVEASVSRPFAGLKSLLEQARRRDG